MTGKMVRDSAASIRAKLLAYAKHETASLRRRFFPHWPAFDAPDGCKS